MARIETARLTLRPFGDGDIAAYAAIRAKPAVVQYLPGGAARAAEAKLAAAQIVPEWAALWSKPNDGPGYGPWAAVERSSGRLLGHLGLRHLAQLNGETEILYMLDAPAWGRGLASEGARAARDYAFEHTGLDHVIALAVPENIGSIRVMQRIGMRYDGPVHVFGIDGLRFVLSREQWLNERAREKAIQSGLGRR